MLKGKIKLTDFALRHFDKKFGGTKILHVTVEKFEEIINTQTFTFDGYAPFCNLISFLNSFTEDKTGSLPIKLENY
ncbi:MAG: DUF3228 family protein, partial [Nanoarchaeota archaeon]